MELSALLREVIVITRKAGAAVMAIYDSSDFGVETKGDDSPLTKADLAANQIIVNSLSSLPDKFPILSEESKQIPYEVRRHWHTFWLVDPLDGTKEFIKRNGEFTVNIALIHDGAPILGVVYAPAINRLYYAANGQKAHVQEGDTNPKPLQVADYRGQRLKVVASRSHAGPALQGFLGRLGDFEVVSMGSSLKLCLVAEGKAHIYPRLGPTMEWDTAAAHAVVMMGGGQVTDLEGESLHYNKEDLLNSHFIVTGNPPYPWRDCLVRNAIAKPQR